MLFSLRHLTSIFLLSLWFSCCSFEGLNYEHVQHGNGQSIHILTVDPSNFKMVAARALDMGIGRETVESLAQRHGAIAAVNGGFFAIGGTYDGIPRGLLKIGSNWYGLPYKPRGAIGWKEDGGEVYFDRLFAKAFVEMGGKRIPIDGLNQRRTGQASTLFSSGFGFTTLTNPDSFEILIENDRIQKMNSHGSSPIPRNGWVLSLPQDLQMSSKGDLAHVEIDLMPISHPEKNWNELDYIVGGCPLLINEGDSLVFYEPEQALDSFIFQRHARTVVGILPDGKWVFVVVDGHLPDVNFGGMTMGEVTEFMESLGCVYALNLDGGGSSTMVYDSKLVNHPKGDKDEHPGQLSVRKVSDAILILKK